MKQNQKYYERFPQDVQKVRKIVRLAAAQPQNQALPCPAAMRCRHNTIYNTMLTLRAVWLQVCVTQGHKSPDSRP